MNKLKEIDITTDGLYFVTKTKEGIWVFVDAEDRDVVLGNSIEDVIARFYSSISNDVISPSDVRIKLLGNNKVEVCVKGDCWECNAEFE
jgi:hypothetical protein